MWKNIKTVVEKQILSENVTITTYSVGQWSLIMMNMHLPSSTNYSQQTNEKTKVIQVVVSTEVPKLNHTVMNKKRDQMQFSLEKGLEKRK